MYCSIVYKYFKEINSVLLLLYISNKIIAYHVYYWQNTWYLDIITIIWNFMPLIVLLGYT